MRIETLSLGDLNPADYNPRKDLQPGDSEYEKLKRSLAEFGYVEPVIWNKTTGHIVGGHQRLKVLADLGFEKCGLRGGRTRRDPGEDSQHCVE